MYLFFYSIVSSDDTGQPVPGYDPGRKPGSRVNPGHFWKYIFDPGYLTRVLTRVDSGQPGLIRVDPVNDPGWPGLTLDYTIQFILILVL